MNEESEMVTTPGRPVRPENFASEDEALAGPTLSEAILTRATPSEPLSPVPTDLEMDDTDARELAPTTKYTEDAVPVGAGRSDEVSADTIPPEAIPTGATALEAASPEADPVDFGLAVPNFTSSEPFELDSMFPPAQDDSMANQEPLVVDPPAQEKSEKALEDTVQADVESPSQEVAASKTAYSESAATKSAEIALMETSRTEVESMDVGADGTKPLNTEEAIKTTKHGTVETSVMEAPTDPRPENMIPQIAGSRESHQSSPPIQQGTGLDYSSPISTEENPMRMDFAEANDIAEPAHADTSGPQAPEGLLPASASPTETALPESKGSESSALKPLQAFEKAVFKPESPHEAQPGSLEAHETSTSSDAGDFDNIDAATSKEAADELPDAMDDHLDDASSELSEAMSTDLISTETTHLGLTPAKSAISHLIGESRSEFASSASALTERSGLSSKPPSISSKATTPLDSGSPKEATSHVALFSTPISTAQPRSAPRIRFDVRPKVSVPTDLTPQEYAVECIEAAENSRLNPYALHQEEYLMLRYHISHAQVTTYLNIRNGILRLWVRNPQIAVTRQEAIGCAKDTRWFDVANLCFDWLVRRGFINYGCVEIRQQRRRNSANEDSNPRKRKTVVVIGAGFSGLGCARQLEGLFTQYSKRFRDMGEDPPRVVVLEGRNRVGGRVYSRAFQTLPDTAPGIFRGKRFTAEMGGMIITGFDRGNPLNILVRGQLGLPYHCLRSDMSLYDTNGTAVDPVRDEMVEHLFNACLDRVSEYKFKSPPSKLIEGNHDLIDEGRDSTAEGHKTIALEEEKVAAQPHAPSVSQQNVAPETHLVPVSTDRMTGKVHVEPGTPGSTRAAFKAKSLGWTLKTGVAETRDVDLDAAASSSVATLGSVVDEALMQHKEILDLNAQDFRLLNWHIANLEYSNATNLNRLSLQGWDIDAGNEWEGKHTMVVGGYQSVARGLSMLPTPLSIRHEAPVKRITYTTDGSNGPARIDTEDGQSIEADYVVNTIPLGVLKHGNIEFQPPLPSWKTEAIDRLGFGVLNKVILVYKEAFWDKDRDIFGMLQTPINRLSLNQKDYTTRRGRFFQWFNVTNTTGMPCLLALMAGDAGYDTEITPNDELVAEATEILRMRYGARVPSQPLEAIVTRWESDRFARGSYSNAGVKMQAEDYQIMARSIGNLHFAGEHTIVTHPATVHGAYLSGLRAASDVLDALLGPIEIPIPLVLPRETSASLKRKAQEENKDPAQARLEAYEMEVQEYIFSKLGYYPIKPGKVAGNPYLLFNKAHYEEGRKRCEEGRRAGKGKPSPNEVRTMTSKMWKEAAPEVRKPFEDAAEEQKRNYAQALKDWTEAAAKWEREALELRERYVKEHPSMPTPEEVAASMTGGYTSGGRRAKKKVATYAEEDSDVDMD
ncbi:Lysine-specific histone demethylase 1A [Cytospora mali]|uniref:Lysine-specific histone demethylase 1A n=1 Tax=Cytospora mali TaxID=578113 RepID=A0A194V8R6_CYTMA|nr:Lysine-specific histone demethylase 1A [Valsa mali var. pyri (nom. inval.)]